VTFPGVGHFPHAERPAEFAAAVIDFVETTAASSYDPQQWRGLLRRGARAAHALPEDRVAALG
jgi:hypothetical protein